MNKAQEATLEKIAVMQAFVDDKEIEYKSACQDIWHAAPNPYWDWDAYDYRIKQEPATHPAFDWSIFADDVQWLAWDKDGIGYLYVKEPIALSDRWLGAAVAKANSIKGVTRGTCDWKDSLIKRPQSN